MSDDDPAGPWFVVANGSRGSAYVKRDGESGYDEVASWDEPDARRRNAELGEDRPGRSFPSAGTGARSGMERDGIDDEPKEHAKRDLAHRIADDLADALRARRTSRVVLIAPAPVARRIQQRLPNDLSSSLELAAHRDLTSVPTGELHARLDKTRRAI